MTMYLLDTNIISELAKSQPNQGVVQFFSKQPSTQLSVITLGEINSGIIKLHHRNDHAQANRLQTWYNQQILPIAHFALPFNMVCALIWSEMMATNPHNAVDKMLAATAIANRLILVTRNEKHIKDTGVSFINPFS